MAKQDPHSVRWESQITLIVAPMPISIKVLKQALSLYLARYYSHRIAAVMVHLLKYEYLIMDKKGTIRISSDSSPLCDNAMLELYARLNLNSCKLRIGDTISEFSIHGPFDIHQLHALCEHYFWLSTTFMRPRDRTPQSFEWN